MIAVVSCTQPVGQAFSLPLPPHTLLPRFRLLCRLPRSAALRARQCLSRAW